MDRIDMSMCSIAVVDGKEEKDTEDRKIKGVESENWSEM